MEIKRSIDEGYIPVSADTLFSSLVKVTRILDLIEVPYIITGGTLLGAVRGGDIISGDTDWDIEILDTSVPKILDSSELFSEQGLKIIYPHLQDIISLQKDGNPEKNCERRIVKIYDDAGNFHGDLFVQTLFSDGMLRRILIDRRAYFNSKMTFPYWFFENRTKISLRGHSFSCPAEPELMVERIYGSGWRIPIDRHAKKPGYNFAGADSNADVEKGILHAIKSGWIPRYPDAPRWPMPVEFTSTTVSSRWIDRHEHLDALPEDFFDSTDFTLDQTNARLVQLYRVKIAEQKKIIMVLLREQSDNKYRVDIKIFRIALRFIRYIYRLIRNSWLGNRISQVFRHS